MKGAYENTAVIFDEAHNIEQVVSKLNSYILIHDVQVSEDGQSLEISVATLQSIESELLSLENYIRFPKKSKEQPIQSCLQDISKMIGATKSFTKFLQEVFNDKLNAKDIIIKEF